MSKIQVIQLGYKSLSGKDTFFNVAKEYGYVRVAFADKLKETVMDLYNFSHDQMHGNSKDIEDVRYPNNIDSERIDITIPPYEKLYFNNDSKFLVDAGSAGNDKFFITTPIINDKGFFIDSNPEWKLNISNPDYKPFFTPRRVLQIFGQNQRALFPLIWASYVFNVKIPKLISEGHTKFIVTDFRFKNEAKVAKEWKNSNPDNTLSFVKINRNISALSGGNDISEVELNDFTEWDFELDNNCSLEEYQSRVRLFLENNFF